MTPVIRYTTADFRMVRASCFDAGTYGCHSGRTRTERCSDIALGGIVSLHLTDGICAGIRSILLSVSKPGCVFPKFIRFCVYN